MTPRRAPRAGCPVRPSNGRGSRRGTRTTAPTRRTARPIRRKRLDDVLDVLPQAGHVPAGLGDVGPVAAQEVLVADVPTLVDERQLLDARRRRAVGPGSLVVPSDVLVKAMAVRGAGSPGRTSSSQKIQWTADQVGTWAVRPWTSMRFWSSWI